LDWAWLYYVGTVELKMSEEEFWNCTHRKLRALLKVHYEYIKAKYNGKKESEECYIDNVSL
jgi:hypothetical protein